MAAQQQTSVASIATAAAEPAPLIRPGEYFYAKLWSRDAKATAVTAPYNPAGATVQNVKLEQGLGTLDDTLLRKYFPWVYEEPALPSMVSMNFQF